MAAVMGQPSIEWRIHEPPRWVRKQAPPGKFLLLINRIDVRGPYVTPELSNELQCNVGNMWENLPYIHMH